MPCVFMTLPPYPTLSRLRRDAKLVARQGDKSYQAVLEQVIHRHVKDLPPGNLGGEYVAHLREHGWLTFLLHGFAVSVVPQVEGLVADNLDPPPVGFSVFPDLLGFDKDPYIGDFDPALIVRLAAEEPADEDASPVIPLTWKEEEVEIMSDPERPIRERLGTLIFRLREALDVLMFRQPWQIPIPVATNDHLLRTLHRDIAYTVREVLDSDYCSYRPHERVVFEYLFIGAAPACAMLWEKRASAAKTEEERTAILRRAVEIGQEVFGPFPIDPFIGGDGFEDWHNVRDYLELRDALVAALSAIGKKKDAMTWRTGLHAEIRRVNALIDKMSPPPCSTAP